MDRLPVEQSKPVVNAPELMARCMGNLEFAQRILAKFQGRCDQDLAELEQALLVQDPTRIQFLAHRIKGASANVAAYDLRDVAGDIENLAMAGRLAEIPPRLEALRRECVRLTQSANLLGPAEAPAG